MSATSDDLGTAAAIGRLAALIDAHAEGRAAVPQPKLDGLSEKEYEAFERGVFCGLTGAACYVRQQARKLKEQGAK